MKSLCLLLYYLVGSRLPRSAAPWVGRWCKRFRSALCSYLFAECGKNVNVERGANFGSGRHIRIGDNSGLGINCSIGGPLVVGRDVMMGPNVILIRQMHRFDRTDLPMRLQGHTMPQVLCICDDVWLGDRVIVLPQVGRIGKGAIIGAGAIITRDVPDYAIVAGSPARVIRQRTLTHDPSSEAKLTLPGGVYE